jgi:hypothetical protein
MRKEFLQHALAYSILIGGLAAIIFGFMVVWPNRIAERYLIMILAAFYFMWGVIAHVKTEHLTWKVVFEYLVVSLLAAVLLSVVTF